MQIIDYSIFGCQITDYSIFGCQITDYFIFGCQITDYSIFGCRITDDSIFGCQITDYTCIPYKFWMSNSVRCINVHQMLFAEVSKLKRSHEDIGIVYPSLY